MKFEKYRKTAFVLSVILSVLWMAYIFSFSAAPAEVSSQDSSEITEMIIRVVEKDYDSLPETEKETVFSLVESKVRKVAHFSLFAVLGVLVTLSCFFFNDKEVLKYVIGYLVCFLYGACDELHQHFSPGRSPLVKDVFIDGAGSAVGVMAVLLVMWIVKSKHSKRSTK